MPNIPHFTYGMCTYFGLKVARQRMESIFNIIVKCYRNEKHERSYDKWKLEYSCDVQRSIDVDMGT